MNQLNSKRTLIIRLTGLGGSYLAEFLLAKGHEMYGIIRRTGSFNTSRIDPLYQDPHATHTRLYLVYGDLNDASYFSIRSWSGETGRNYNLWGSFDVPECTAEVAGGSLCCARCARARQCLFSGQAVPSEVYGRKLLEFPVKASAVI